MGNINYNFIFPKNLCAFIEQEDTIKRRTWENTVGYDQWQEK